MSGTTQAAVFNPWDRALYLAVLHKRPFCRWANFDKPFQGFGQVLDCVSSTHKAPRKDCDVCSDFAMPDTRLTDLGKQVSTQK